MVVGNVEIFPEIFAYGTATWFRYCDLFSSKAKSKEVAKDKRCLAAHSISRFSSTPAASHRLNAW